MGKIFDKTTVKEKQELSQRFGEEAYKLVHVISEENGWAEGSAEKIALHAFVGGLMSSLGDGDVLAGATGAGFNEAIQEKLSKIQDPALRQWASIFVGAAAANTVSGDAQTGGSTAASGTKNNALFEGPNSIYTAIKTKGQGLLRFGMGKWGPLTVFSKIAFNLHELDPGTIDSDTNLTSSNPDSPDYDHTY